MLIKSSSVFLSQQELPPERTAKSFKPKELLNFHLNMLKDVIMIMMIMMMILIFVLIGI